MESNQSAPRGSTYGKVLRASWITSIPLLGQVARAFARCYREGSVTRIKTGIGRGLLWKRSHRYQSGFYLGTYEPLVQEFLASKLNGGSVFWDVGANAGFFSLLGSKLVGADGAVVAFEPFPESAHSIREQVDLNGLGETCEVVEAAVSSSVGKAQLRVTDHNAMHHLDPEGEIQVPTVTLDSRLDSSDSPQLPDLVKIDVEGAELEVLAGARFLVDSGTKWLIEAHGEENERRLRELFGRKGYLVSELGQRDLENKILLTAEIRQSGPPQGSTKAA